jgi:EAL domain-containing protein (putative c-di-GMP-specific phosphodiesterase class I)
MGDRRSLRRLSVLRASGEEDFVISVNLSARQLRQRQFVAKRAACPGAPWGANRLRSSSK